MRVRQARFPGSFYPGDSVELGKVVDGFLSEAKSTVLPNGTELKAIIVPHAGYEYSGIVAGAGYKLLRSSFKDEKIKSVVLGPSHYAAFEGVITDDNDYWETPLGKVKVDKSRRVGRLGEVGGEHSIEVQVPFLQKSLKDFEVLPLMYGDIKCKKLSEMLLPLADENTVFVVSSDLSHYYTYDEAVGIDKASNEFIPKMDIERAESDVEACGKTGILALMLLGKKLEWKGIFLDYRNSGDTGGEKSRVVGYGAYAFYA